MKALGLLLLRVSTGGLLVTWGLDKIVNTEHGVAVATNFYLGIGQQPWLQRVLGVLQIILGLLVIVGFMRKLAYPVAFVVLGITAVAVWRSIIDPLGLMLDGPNLLFYPSSIIFAATIVLWGTMSEDTLAVDARLGGGSGGSDVTSFMDD